MTTEEFNAESQAAKSAIPRRRENAEAARPYPVSLEAEQGVICSFLLAPREMGSLCSESGITAAHFHSPAWAGMFSAIWEMWGEGIPADVVTLTRRLHERGILAQLGGASKVSEAFTFLPTAANARYYLEILEEKHTLRTVIDRSTIFARRAYDEEPAADIITAMEVSASELAMKRFRRRSGSVREAVMSLVEKCAAGKTEEAWGLSTGFANLDAIMRGLRSGNCIAIGGETSAGKTALALNLIHNLSVKRGVSADVFSLEMTREEVVEVLVQIGSGANVDAVAEQRVNQHEMEAFLAAGEAVARAPLRIHDERDFSISDIRSICRATKPRLIMIDYAQLVRGSKGQYSRDDLEVKEVSRSTKKMAGELDATSLLLTQLTDGKTMGSRTIGMDADQLLIVEDDGDDENKRVKVCKQRRGKRDAAYFRFIGACQKFLPKAIKG